MDAVVLLCIDFLMAVLANAFHLDRKPALGGFCQGGMRKAIAGLIDMAVSTLQRRVVYAFEDAFAVYRGNDVVGVDMQTDRLPGTEGKLVCEQAVAGLALGIRRLFHIAMTGLAGLPFHVGDQFGVDFAHMGIVEGRVTALAETDRVGAHGVGRAYIMPAMTVSTGGEVGVVLGLEMPRVM